MRKMFFLFLSGTCAGLLTPTNLKAVAFPQLSNPAPILTPGSSASDPVSRIEKKKIWPHAAVLRALSNCWKPACWPWKSSDSEIKTEKETIKKYPTPIPKIKPAQRRKIRVLLKNLSSKYPKDILNSLTQENSSTAKRIKILNRFDKEQTLLIHKYWPHWKDPAAQNSATPITVGGGGGSSSEKKKNKKNGISGGTGAGSGGGGGGGSGRGGASSPSSNQSPKNSNSKTASLPIPLKTFPKPISQLKKTPAPKTKKSTPKIHHAPTPVQAAKKSATPKPVKTKPPLLNPKTVTPLNSRLQKPIPSSKANKKSPKTQIPKKKPGLTPSFPSLKNNPPSQAQKNAAPGLELADQSPRHSPKSIKTQKPKGSLPLGQAPVSKGKAAAVPPHSAPAPKNRAEKVQTKSRPLPLDSMKPPSKTSSPSLFLLSASISALAVLIFILWMI